MSEPTLEEPLTVDKLHRILGETNLTALDRCDRCGAQAYVRLAVANTALDLMFCAHHYRPLRDDSRFTIIRDESARLTSPEPMPLPAFLMD